MSMTQMAFLRKAEIPTKQKIQESINSLGYDFKIMDDFETFYDVDGLTCKINGHETWFEIYFHTIDEIADDIEWIKPDLTDQDTAISFIWGANLAAGACIGLVSVALIDLSNALVYYMDDEMPYTREMLISDTPEYLKELDKLSNRPH